MATIWYVDMAVGNDGNLGTSPGVGNAWKTLGKTQTAPIAAGDTVYVKGSADYTETLTIAVVGAALTPVIFEGYTATPGDGGLATVDGGASRTTGMTPAAGSNYVVFKNFRFTNHTGVGAGNLTGDHFTYKGCEFDNNGGDGVDVDAFSMFEGCYSHDNGGDGFESNSYAVYLCCISNSNGAMGFNATGANFYKCIAFSNNTTAFAFGSNTSFNIACDCVADGDSKDSTTGFSVSGSALGYRLAIINCVAYDCVTGFDGYAGNNNERTISRNNCVNANTTPYVLFQTFTGEVTAAPAFVSEATQDYTPDTGSPLIGAGFGPETNDWITQTGDASDIGAMDEVGGGGSTDYPAEVDVRDGTDFNFGVLTGELLVPSPTDVRDGVGTDATIGSCHVPVATDVRFGIDVDATTGLCHVPAAIDVRFGTDVDATTGLCEVPAATDVRDTIPVDAGTGSLIVPAVTDVRLGVDVDTPATHGTLILPATGDVRAGVHYDDGIIEGTLAGGGGGGAFHLMIGGNL